MRYYIESLPNIETTSSVFNKKQSVTYLKELRKRLKDFDYIAICNDLYIDDRSSYLSGIVSSIDSKILRAQKLMEIKSENRINESEWIGVAWLCLWSTLNDIFYLRYNLNPYEWLLLDPNNKILQLAIIDGKSFDIIKFKGDPSNDISIREARSFFFSALDRKLNPENYNDYKRAEQNSIEFLRHLIGIYYKELIEKYRSCRLKRNNHELIHGSIGNPQRKKSHFNFDAIKDIGNIIEALLFLD